MMKPRRRAWLKTISLLNIFLVIGDWFLVDIVSERTKATALLAILPQAPFFMLSAAVLLACAVSFRWRLLVANLVAIVPFAWGLLGIQVHSVPPHAEGVPLRVLTYNTHEGTGGWQNIAKVVLDQKPDLFCLQEMLGIPDSEIEGLFPGYQVIHRGEFVLGSKWPIRNVLYVAYHGHAVRSLRVETGGVTLQTTHLASFDNWRKMAVPDRGLISKSERVLAYHAGEAQDIVEMDQSISPLILCGDFNAPPRGAAYRILRRSFIDSFEASGTGFGYTHPSILPFQRIDYVMTRGVTPIDCHPVYTRLSDHLPVVATLVVPKP